MRVRSRCQKGLQAPDMATQRSFWDTSWSDLPTPLVPCQVQAQGLHHDEKLHDVRGLLQRQEARRGLGWERCGTHSWRSGGHDNLWLTLPWMLECYVTRWTPDPRLAEVGDPGGAMLGKTEPALDLDPCCARDVSYLGFMPKPSTHHMHDPGSIAPHI
jgi:hypothetical protein